MEESGSSEDLYEYLNFDDSYNKNVRQEVAEKSRFKFIKLSPTWQRETLMQMKTSVFDSGDGWNSSD